MFIRLENGCWPAVMAEPSDRAWLRRLFGTRVKFEAPLAAYTSFKIGGPADVLVEPKSTEEIKAVIQWAQRKKIPYLTIGGGTNLLVQDGGVRGVVVVMGPHWSDVKWDRRRSAILVTAAAGTPTRRICRLALKHGWKGANFALGIPGSLGGAVLMNAGTRHGCMADIVQSLTVMTAEGNMQRVDRERIASSYRQVALPIRSAEGGGETPILVSATLALEPGDREQIRHEASEMMKVRVQRQAAWEPSAGCVFRNPSDRMPAGRLIDEAGLKGTAVGGARISPRHANFIVNTGDATARDVTALVATIQKRVMAYHGNQLELEVRIVGEEEADAKKPA
jgi:UDP-N-acetylmuramate dehydrogenase